MLYSKIKNFNKQINCKLTLTLLVLIEELIRKKDNYKESAINCLKEDKYKDAKDYVEMIQQIERGSCLKSLREQLLEQGDYETLYKIAKGIAFKTEGSFVEDLVLNKKDYFNHVYSGTLIQSKHSNAGIYKLLGAKITL
jgi:hypothetical protein